MNCRLLMSGNVSELEPDMPLSSTVYREVLVKAREKS
jgi:hypothetical protein